MHTFPNFYSFTRHFGLVSKLRLSIHRRGKNLLLHVDRIVKMSGFVSAQPWVTTRGQIIITCICGVWSLVCHSKRRT